MKACASLVICWAVLGSLWGSVWAQAPQSVWDHVGNGDTLKNHGEWDAALLEYRQAVALAPNDSEIHFYFGIALYRQHLFDEAVQELQTSVRLDSENVVRRDALKNANTMPMRWSSKAKVT